MVHRFLIPLLICIWSIAALPAYAAGTAQVRQSNGQSKMYKNVNIKMNGENFAVTTADGAGLLVVSSLSTQLSAHGVLLTMTTKAGPNVSISGTVDEMQK